MNNWEELLKKKLADWDTSIENLFTPPFSWTEIVTFLRAAIEVAEHMFPESGSGVDKRKLVMGVWNYYNEAYELTKKVDKLVDFRKILGGFIGGIVEQFDERAVDAIVKWVIIPALVGVIFPHFNKSTEEYNNQMKL